MLSSKRAPWMECAACGVMVILGVALLGAYMYTELFSPERVAEFALHDKCREACKLKLPHHDTHSVRWVMCMEDCALAARQ